ncbi:hypothetical protein C8F01DRAFT_218170, partial [Mycena amicta]
RGSHTAGRRLPALWSTEVNRLPFNFFFVLFRHVANQDRTYKRPKDDLRLLTAHRSSSASRFRAIHTYILLEMNSLAPYDFKFDYPVRVPRACANCRSSKTKCVTDSQDKPCMRCCFSSLECVYEPTERQRERSARTGAGPRPSHKTTTPKPRARRGRKRLAVRPPPVIPYPPSPTSSASQYDCDELYCRCPSESHSPAGSPGPCTPAGLGGPSYLPTEYYPATTQVPQPPMYAAQGQWIDNYTAQPTNTFDSHGFVLPTMPNGYPPALPDSACLPQTFAGQLTNNMEYSGYTHGHAHSSLGLFDLALELNDFPFALPPVDTNQTFYAHLQPQGYSHDFL